MQSCQLAQALLHTDGKDPDVKSAAVEPNQDEAWGPTTESSPINSVQPLILLTTLGRLGYPLDMSIRKHIEHVLRQVCAELDGFHILGSCRGFEQDRTPLLQLCNAAHFSPH